MCAIIDRNAAIELMGPKCPNAGTEFLRRVEGGKLKVVVGGKLRQELNSTKFRQWIVEALRAGRAESINDDRVNRESTKIRNAGMCQSNDPHIIALAQISGARLLYTNDKDLHTDFKDRRLIDIPRGKIYTTNEYKEFHRNHRRLLDRNDLCGAY